MIYIYDDHLVLSLSVSSVAFLKFKVKNDAHWITMVKGGSFYGTVRTISEVPYHS
jgi:hypothetical protein